MEPPKSYKENLRRMSQERFTWDEESDKAFAELKDYLRSPQLLSRPESGETLQLYLAILDVAVSSVLIREAEGTQRPIYYVSHMLRGAEERTPLQVPIQEEEIVDPQEFEWSVHVDGARNDKRAGAGVLIIGPQGIILEYALRFKFHTTNNEAEYEAMIMRLKLVKSLNIIEVLVKGDSKLMIDRIQGKWAVKSEVLKRYHSKDVSLALGFSRISVMHIQREQNEKTDWLSKLATTYYNELARGVYVEMCNQSSYEESTCLGNAPQLPACTMNPVVSLIPSPCKLCKYYV
ncbi:hypothetical protein LIER_30749 [Lithospermum erythrorhizon]|uniref:RNase H type-1 domain-containing protein n=1 Tax=Lithospermum erythrorhizon TaxID=34254 RepID=A0AAV3RNR5_LITER